MDIVTLKKYIAEAENNLFYLKVELNALLLEDPKVEEAVTEMLNRTGLSRSDFVKFKNVPFSILAKKGIILPRTWTALWLLGARLCTPKEFAQRFFEEDFAATLFVGEKKIMEIRALLKLTEVQWRPDINKVLLRKRFGKKHIFY